MASSRKAKRKQLVSLLWGKHAWKADFNQCTGCQLMGALRRAEEKFTAQRGDLPFVLIGHSKLFNRINESSLRPLLAYVARNAPKYAFSTFGLELDRLARPAGAQPTGEKCPSLLSSVGAAPLE